MGLSPSPENLTDTMSDPLSSAAAAAAAAQPAAEKKGHRKQESVGVAFGSDPLSMKIQKPQPNLSPPQPKAAASPRKPQRPPRQSHPSSFPQPSTSSSSSSSSPLQVPPRMPSHPSATTRIAPTTTEHKQLQQQTSVSTKLTQAIDAKRAEFRPEAVKAELSRLFRGPVPMYAATDLPVSLESLATLRKHRDWAKLGQYSTTLRKYMEHKSKEWSVGDKLSLAYFSALSLLLTGKLAECQRMLEFMFGLGSIKQLVHVLNDKEIIQDHFVFSNLCLLYGDLLVKLKQRGSALQFYFGVLHQYKLLNAKTQNAHVHVSRNVALAVATLFADEQDWPNALNMLSQVLSWYPDDPQHSFTVWSKLGHMHAQLGDVVQTTQCFTNAVESFSGEEWAAKQADSTSYYALQDVYNRAMLRVLQGEYNRAHVLVTPCLMHFQAIKPGHESYGVLTSLMNLLALCAVHNNSVDEAIDALERVVAKFPMYRLDTRVTSNLRVLYQLASDNYKIKHVMLDVLEFMYP